MKTHWQCFTWQGSGGKPQGEPAQTWTSPEGAVEFLRRELSEHGLYSKQVLVTALADLRNGRPVLIDNELPHGGRLNLSVQPVQTSA